MSAFDGKKPLRRGPYLALEPIVRPRKHSAGARLAVCVGNSHRERLTAPEDFLLG